MKAGAMSINNITRFLDSRKVQYSTFELPPQKVGALETASLLDVSPSIIFKSIVLIRKTPGKPILAVVPAIYDVDLKAVAKFLGEKKVSPATQKEAERLTKLQVGGISPLALINRGFEIIIHESVLEQEEVHVSGGELGLNIRLPSRDLIEITGASIALIC
jgi:Cys-tRNA(Pro)/Cys-tRNA(Cys) deacylase